MINRHDANRRAKGAIPQAAKVRPDQPNKHLSCEATRKCALATFASLKLARGGGSLRSPQMQEWNFGKKRNGREARAKATLYKMSPATTEWFKLRWTK
jgi:hypothetical protein